MLPPSSVPELKASTPFSFLLFGASGNLAQLKIYPALYTLALKKRLPARFNVVGFARTPMSDDAFRTLVSQAIRRDMLEVNEAVLTDFLSHVHYHAGQYDRTEDFTALHTLLQKLEGKQSDWVRVAYLSVPPSVFTSILTNLSDGGIHQRSDRGRFRCIVEKPVGSDLASFEAIRSQLMTCFDASEVYLLDHYLGKEAVRNIYYLRFANPVLERLLKNTLIHHVEITAAETLGIEGRAGYFEQTGMLRDFFQSHLLLMGALLTMRIRETEDALLQSRLNALEQFYLPPARDMNAVLLQGQYGAGMVGKHEAMAYRSEKGVAPDSRTNTFVALKLLTRTSRWEGIPFYLRAGKRLAKKETRVSILFQEPHPVGQGSTPNRLDIILQGEAGMRLHLQTKIGGSEPAFRPMILEDPLVCVGDCLPEHGLLLLEAIHGKRQWFLTFEEVHAAWRLMDPLQAHLDRPDVPLHLYPAGSDGPSEASAWLERDGLSWLR